MYVLTQANKKYKGDALLQKSFTVDFLTKKTKPNEGEVPQYYVENSHPAIIKPETFDLVQAEIARRARGKSRYSGVGIFSSRIKCAECGSWYGSKVWHSNDKYRKVVWRCNHKYDGGEKCATPHFDEETIKTLFVRALNIFCGERDEIIVDFSPRSMPFPYRGWVLIQTIRKKGLFCVRSNLTSQA